MNVVLAQQFESVKSSVLLRILSATVLVPPLLLLLLVGSPLHFFLLVMVVAALLIYEWHQLTEGFSWPQWLPLLAAVSMILVVHMPLQGDTSGFSQTLEESWHRGNTVPLLPDTLLYALILFGFFVEGLWQYVPGSRVLERVGNRFLGVVYCTLPLVLTLKIRVIEQGGLLILFLLLVIWATDVGAYFIGKQWGNKKLAPHISPGKTRAGFVGGLVLAMIVGAGVASFVKLSFTVMEAVAVAILVSITGQVGDLAESLIKREVGKKDSSQLIPGHGGVLDRLDSFLFAVPVYYLYLWLTQT